VAREKTEVLVGGGATVLSRISEGRFNWWKFGFLGKQRQVRERERVVAREAFRAKGKGKSTKGGGAGTSVNFEGWGGEARRVRGGIYLHNLAGSVRRRLGRIRECSGCKHHFVAKQGGGACRKDPFRFKKSKEGRHGQKRSREIQIRRENDYRKRGIPEQCR